MNKIIRNRILVLIFLVYAGYACMAGTLPGEELPLIDVNTGIDKARVTIGDKVRYKVKIDFSEKVEVSLPEISDTLGGLTVEDSDVEESRENGRITWEITYTLDTFKAGSYIIPPIDIKYSKGGGTEDEEVKTTEVYVEFLSMLDENATDIRGISPPLSINKSYFRLYMIIAIVFGVLAIAGGVTLFLFRRKNKGAEFVPEPLPPHQIAYNELENLKALNLIPEGKIKEYYYRLSNIVRQYIEARFRLMAPERTTEEFLAEMATTDRLEDSHKELVRNFLEHCDMVKFAEYGPGNQEIENAFGYAKKLVDETKEIVVEEIKNDNP